MNLTQDSKALLIGSIGYNKIMVTAGLTGNYGMGKSSVASMFRKLGAFTIDSDKVVAGLLDNKKIIAEISRIFGPEVLTAAGNLDRRAIAEKVFSDSARRKKLESILHPLVFKSINTEMGKIKDRKSIVIVEVPLLFEGGFQEHFDKTITVYTTRDTALTRLKEKGISRKDAVLRFSAQMDIRLKRKLSDYTINNNGTAKQTELQVIQIYRLLREDCSILPNKGQRRL